MSVKRHAASAAYYRAEIDLLREQKSTLVDAAEEVLWSKNASMLRPEVLEKLEAAVEKAKERPR